MRYVVVLALAFLFVNAPVGEAKKPSPKQPPCSLTGSRTMVASQDARLFTKVDVRHETRSVYACLYARNRRFLLGDAETGPGGSGDITRLATLAGGYVAYALGRFDDSQRYNPEFKGFPEQVVAINLSTAAQLHFPAATGNPPTASVSDLVLSRSGSFAWVGSGAAGNEIHRLNAGDAADAVLDSGPDVQAGSLALAGSTLYWTKAGKPAAAQIR